MSAHTPGPWLVHPRWPGLVVPVGDASKARGGSLNPDQEAERYAKEIHFDSGTPWPEFHRSRVLPDEAKANARLIAAAPDLLEAARAALRWVAGNTPMIDSADPTLGPIADEADRVRAVLRAAIAKTEGRDA